MTSISVSESRKKPPSLTHQLLPGCCWAHHAVGDPQAYGSKLHCRRSPPRTAAHTGTLPWVEEGQGLGRVKQECYTRQQGNMEAREHIFLEGRIKALLLTRLVQAIKAWRGIDLSLACSHICKWHWNLAAAFHKHSCHPGKRQTHMETALRDFQLIWVTDECIHEGSLCPQCALVRCYLCTQHCKFRILLLSPVHSSLFIQ